VLKGLNTSIQVNCWELDPETMRRTLGTLSSSSRSVLSPPKSKARIPPSSIVDSLGARQCRHIGGMVSKSGFSIAGMSSRSVVSSGTGKARRLLSTAVREIITEASEDCDWEVVVLRAKQILDSYSHIGTDNESVSEEDRHAAIRNMLEARDQLISAAKSGHCEAQFQLGSFYAHFPNIEAGLQKEAESKKDVLKEIKVVKINNKRRLKEKKLKDRGVTEFDAASDEQDLSGMNDGELAHYWLRCAATSGHGRAMCLLANRLLKTDDKADDVLEAISWYEKAAALEPPLTEALYNLGTVYFEGNDVANIDADAVRALGYFRLAAQLGDTDAHYWLGHVHSSGHIPQWIDPDRAIVHFMEAHKLGHSNALFRVAVLYRYGMSRQAFLQQLQEQRQGQPQHQHSSTCSHADHDSCSHAQPSEEPVINSFNDLQSSPELFRGYLQRSIMEDNDDEAIAMLAEMKLFGTDGESKNETEAFELFQQAHALGNTHAAYCLGVMHYNGHANLPKDAAKAFEYYNIAAEGGGDSAISAYRNLAAMYYCGDGVEKSETMAKDIMKTISSLGYDS
jgi:TPR repeat protein